MSTAAALEAFLKEHPSFYKADDTGTSAKAIEDYAGAALPEDYKWLIETIGCGGSAEGPGLNIDAPETALAMGIETTRHDVHKSRPGVDTTGHPVS